MIYEIKDLTSLDGAADWLIQAIGDRRVVAFDAPMGAGKTTLISHIITRLGADDPASSPTFSIVNSYNVPGKKPIYHFDFYRMDSNSDIADIGIYDYIDSGSYCLIEWPRLALPFLPSDTVVAVIRVNDDDSRTLELLNI